MKQKIKVVLTAEQYLRTIARSKKVCREYDKSHAYRVTEQELTGLCHREYGDNWVYSERLECCVNQKTASHEELNKQDITRLQEAASANIQATNIGTSLGPSGIKNFRGRWGDTPQVTVDAELHTEADLATVEMGTNPQYQLIISGDTKYTGGFLKRTSPTQEAKKNKVIHLKI
jgi:hypothetical protein